MRKTEVRFLADAANARVYGKEDNIVSGVAIDSRMAGEGDMFVCVVGEVNDGHNYIDAAYAQGTRVFLVSSQSAAESIALMEGATAVLAEDTQIAFGLMGKAYLDQFDVIKLGVTGSVGKTSTKMLTADVLSEKYKTICTQKNYNTYLGLSMTCFLVDDNTQAAVFEMGMDKPGEIDSYCRLIRPHVAIITNVGITHIERLGSRDAIADAKYEICNFLEAGDMLVYNSDSDYLNEDEILRRCGDRFLRMGCGSEGPDIRVSGIESFGLEGIEFDLAYGNEKRRMKLPLVGAHSALNAALAAGAGLFCGLSFGEIASAFEKASAYEGRMNITDVKGVTLIDDSYNASPASCAAALAALKEIKAKRHIAVLADMLELGSEEEKGHLDTGAAAAFCDLLVCVGSRARLYAEGAKGGNAQTFCFDSTDEAIPFILDLISEGDAVLVKGSNSTKISKAANAIKER